jgi:hypothetical protein
MSKRLQIYYTAVLGALGGLLGWWSVGTFETTTWPLWLAYPLVGAGLGLCIAACVAATDGALIKRSRRRAVLDALRGGLFGALCGALGLSLAGALFVLIGGGFAGRAVGWMLLGVAIGLSDLAVSGRRTRAWLGAFGGLVGGLAGGVLYEALTQVFLARSGQAQVVLGGVGLVLVGAAIGALIPFARQALARGELRVTHGEQVGLVREVLDGASIGRYDGNDLYLPDAGVAWRHAVIERDGSGFRLNVLPGAEGGVCIGARTILPGGTARLGQHEQLTLGAAGLEFRSSFSRSEHDR